MCYDKYQRLPAYEKKIYSKILKKLLSLYPKGLKGHAGRRLKKLAGLVCGMIRKKKSSMRALGSGLPQYITAHSREKASKLFLDNAWNDYETHYMPYMEAFLTDFIEQAGTQGVVYLVIDGSQMGNKHVALMVSLLYKGRGIPICWVVKKGGKGHFTSQMHLDLIQSVEQYYAKQLAQQPVVLLGDGEFDSDKLQSFCQGKFWKYAFRTACDTVLYENQDRFQAKNLAVPEGLDYLFIPDVEFTRKRFKNVNFLLWHSPKHDDPIPIVSNFDNPLDIIEAYGRRYSVECLFKDLKSNSFNLHKTRLKSAFAISNLIMVAAFAFTLLIKLGTKYEKHPLRKYIHRIRSDRKEFSIYFFALELIDHFLDEDIDFDFSFQFSNFSMNSS